MEKIEQWDRIAELIALDKKRALGEFHRHAFAPGDFPERPLRPLFQWKQILRPAFITTAASLFLVLGLVSFWLLRGGWQELQPPPASVLLSGSFLYASPESFETERPADGAPLPFSPYFSACAAAALTWPVAAMEPVSPSAAVEHGDPEAVRRKMSQVIQGDTLEQLMKQLREMQNKEA